MYSWVRKFKNSSGQTKFFIFNWMIYGLLLVLTTLYCYGRLDYVRSYKVNQRENQPSKEASYEQPARIPST